MSNTDTTRQIGLIVVVLLALLLVLPLLFGGMGTMGGGMYGPMMGGGGMYGPMMGTTGDTTVPGWVVAATLLVRLLGIAVLVAGGYLLYRVFTRSSGGDSAMEELRLAYARGDLSDEEYERRRETLRAED